eukprot:TRINITY_DN33457_c0_g1_i3.p1 TRINITY_DN33457_c0_g1~~TRINITY_DN33457_c0_g1_i3.p1  ORF type:complete len:183 (-),score=21.23 TRINITY_DN33457_c0_g1_i3:242-790(-)
MERLRVDTRSSPPRTPPRSSQSSPNGSPKASPRVPKSPPFRPTPVKSLADRMSELEEATESSERRMQLTATEAEELRQENREIRAEVRRLQVELDATRTLRREEVNRLTRELEAERDHVAALTAQFSNLSPEGEKSIQVLPAHIQSFASKVAKIASNIQIPAEKSRQHSSTFGSPDDSFGLA